MRQRVRLLLIDQSGGSGFLDASSIDDSLIGSIERVSNVGDWIAALASGRHDVALLNSQGFDRDEVLDLIRRSIECSGKTPIVLSMEGEDRKFEAQAIAAGVSEILEGPTPDLETIDRMATRALARESGRRKRRKTEWAVRKARRARGSSDHAGHYASTHDLKGNFLEASASTRAVLGYEPDHLVGRSPFDWIHPDDLPVVQAAHQTFLGSRASVRVNCRFRKADGQWIWLENTFKPVEDAKSGELIEILCVTRDRSGWARTPRNLLSPAEQVERRLKRLEGLHRIDQTIISAVELRESLGLIVEEAISQLGLDAADISLFGGSAQTVGLTVGRGLPTVEDLESLGCKRIGFEVAKSSTPLHLPDLANSERRDDSVQKLRLEGFQAYHAAPLGVVGSIRGVIQLFHGSPFEPDQDWLDHFDRLAFQASVAINHSSLIEGLRKANERLTLTYEATIEGWARILDQRARASRDHSLRVAETTVRVAEVMGIEQAELGHIRRGALLHDLAGMGPEDQNRLVSSPADHERSWPREDQSEIARELIWPIEFLRPALDILRSLRERWDGAGSPRRLEGANIPLAARICSAVDLWDSLLHGHDDQPAIAESEARDRIRSLAGSQLDPEVVEVLFQVVESHPSVGLERAITSVATPRSESNSMIRPGKVPIAPESIPRASSKSGESSDLVIPGRWKVLVAEDDPATAQVLARLLRRIGYEVEVASDGEQAWEIVRKGGIRIVLADWSMPIVDGPTLCQRIRALRGRPYVYLLLITARDGFEDRLHGLSSGIDDYLTKPIDPCELGARLEIARRVLNMQEGLLERSILAENMHAELQLQNGKLSELAVRDPLTGLFNRRHLRETLDSQTAISTRNGAPISLIMLDVDRFKLYNDDFGHGAGDDVLCRIAQIIRANLRSSDLAARYGGEEFVVLLPDSGSLDASKSAERLRASIAHYPWQLRPVTASLGIATVGSFPWDGDRLIEEADKAMYRSKRSGRNQVTHHDHAEWHNLPSERGRRPRGLAGLG